MRNKQTLGAILVAYFLFSSIIHMMSEKVAFGLSKYIMQHKTAIAMNQTNEPIKWHRLNHLRMSSVNIHRLLCAFFTLFAKIQLIPLAV